MRKLLLMKRLAVLILSATLFYSCSDSTEVEQVIKADPELLVSEAMARTIAEKFEFSDPFNAGKRMKKDVEKILSVPDRNNQAAYYIINYENGGFVILSGDKRAEPVLAYSETNSFPVDSDLYPSGLVGWLYDTKEGVEKLRSAKEKPSAEISLQWNELAEGRTNGAMHRVDPVEPDCTPYVIQKGPYLSTTWGQGCGYNSRLPAMSCSVPCGRAYTGCVATAMAQVMRYHQYPSSYSWSNMPANYGTSSTATLMKDIGSAVSMDYKCDGSGADTKDKVASAFRGRFGYSSASYADYDYQTVKSQLNYGRPVILRGGRNTGWWIFGQYSDGHAWVCDGYSNYVNPCWGSTLRFHMNWGWNGSHDGWYSFNNFNPGDHTFNYKRGMVYNIRP